MLQLDGEVIVNNFSIRSKEMEQIQDSPNLSTSQGIVPIQEKLEL